MSDIDTIEEAAEVLRSAAEAVERDPATAQALLERLRDSMVVTGDDWTHVRYLLGETSWQLGDMAAAREFYDEASVGSGEYAGHARERMQQLDEITGAQSAAEDGVGADELDSVINGAGEAVMREDWATAEALYRRIYERPDLDAERSALVTYELGECLFNLGRFDEARQFLEWTVAYGDDSWKETAQKMLDSLTAHEHALDAAADGASATEVRDLTAEATASYNRGDYDSAEMLYQAVLDNPAVPAAYRARVIFNMGQIAAQRHDYDTAKSLWEQAAAMGDSSVQTYAAERLDMLSRMDESLQIAGILED